MNNKQDSQAIDELIDLIETVLGQNYITFKTQHFIRDDRLAMGSPLPGISAHIYLNLYEHSYWFSKNTYNNMIIFYTRYVDDRSLFLMVLYGRSII